MSKQRELLEQAGAELAPSLVHVSFDEDNLWISQFLRELIEDFDECFGLKLTYAEATRIVLRGALKDYVTILQGTDPKEHQRQVRARWLSEAVRQKATREREARRHSKSKSKT